MDTAIMWFRRDLRVADNPALAAATQRGSVLPLFVLDPRFKKDAETPRMAFLRKTLAALDRRLDYRLVIRRGDPVEIVPNVAKEIEAKSVHFAHDFGPYGTARDERVIEALSAEVVREGSPYAVAPGSVRKADNGSYSVFTPFYRAWLKHGWESPSKAPRLRLIEGVRSEPLPKCPPLPKSLELPRAGEQAAAKTWAEYLDESISKYGSRRNRPDLDATSRLSPHLKVGAIHPRTLLADLSEQDSDGARVFRKELAWREFYADVLYRHPERAWRCLNPKFEKLQLDSGSRADQRFRAWTEGETGYPIVDAGMRQLLREGWMHNRIRMIVASFLVKDLHIDWTRGASHFMRWLIDGDLASNNHGWQWVAGCGTDAAPFFRVFNPVLQGKKFDPHGDYVRRYLPALAHIEGSKVHEPWLLEEPPVGYPDPIVDHMTERIEAMRRFQSL
jgi:deoxyribodipyrimidine photo-lyase